MRQSEKINRIDEINKSLPLGVPKYQVSSNGRVYTEVVYTYPSKTVRTYTTIEEVEKEVARIERSKNARENVDKVVEFLEENGGQLLNKSTFGSRYYDFKGRFVRVSNHHETDQIGHRPVDLNLMSFEKDGYVELIEKLK